MTQSQSLSQDLAYLIDLAEQGRAAPLMGGRMALWWGSLSSIALLIQWAILSGFFLSEPALMALWLGFAVIGVTGAALLGRTLRGKPGVNAVNNRVSGAVWGFMAILIGLYTIGVLAGILLGQAPITAADTILGVAFAGYAIAFYVCARLSNDKASYVFAMISAGLVILVGAFIGQTAVYLVGAAGVAVTAVGSGLYQMSREPGTTV